MNKGTLIISKYRVPNVLIAENALDQTVGLMGRDGPLPAMAFSYCRAQTNAFWMKNTKQALDIIFCLDNQIISICKGEPYSTSLIGNVFSDLVVELPFGTCQASDIKIGDDIRLLSNPLNAH